ncbi:endospore germination permease [Petroclostridium sp. X23]|uniref:GerAB/ArcD/ProY family transporter n=1 Tax=Petroclostridium sp. X23 TaxID=3045146 RepID=UPI0024ADD6FA|nr:endospore germination permease [Petroclostridium sp. X23]WHH58632.1 endospore germination permease [Petroclostridium sp. X23]
MRLEKGEISSSQLMFLIGGLIQGSVLTLSFINQITNHDTWLAILAALVICLLLVLIYIAIAQRFPGKNLIQIHDIIYGHYLGKLISALYVWLFLSIFSFQLGFLGDFFLIYIMPETPLLVIAIMFAFICAWAVRSGIEVIARISVIFVGVTLIIVFLTFVLLLKDMKWVNFLPVFDIPVIDFMQGTHVIASIPFLEVLVFLMIIPYMNEKNQVKSAVLSGLLIGGATLLIISVRDTAVLGIISTIVGFPAYDAVRLIDIAKILTRLEVLIAINMLNMIFIKASVFYYAGVLGMAQLLHLRSYVPLVLPIGIISIILGVASHESTMEFAYFGSSIWPVFSILFYFIIPLMSLLIAKIRRVPKMQRGKCR